MSLLKSEDQKKWINAFVMLCSVLVGYVSIRFMYQLGEWFDLESKVNYFLGLSQVLGVVIGLGAFITTLKHKRAYKFLTEVYGELVKVVWPDNDTVVKLTVGIVIAISIISGILVFIDFVFRELLALIL